MSFTVFLGNLPTWVTADDIKQWLTAEDLVADSIKVIRNHETQESKGFAFVEASTADEMQAIIRRFDRAPLEDRLLRANPAQPPRTKEQKAKQTADSARYRMGESAGLIFLSCGGSIPCGRFRAACAIAVCTSCAAASMSRPSSNCRVMLVEPWPDCELIDSIPATVASCRSSGVATVVAMVSGLAPGSDAEMRSVGKSTCGRSLTGSCL